MSPSRPRRGDRGGSRRRPATARISNGLALRRNPGYRLRCSERRNGSSRERPGPPATAKQQAQLFASPERSLYSKGEEGPIKRRPAVCNGFLRRASRSYEGPVNTNLRPFLQTRPACLAALECTEGEWVRVPQRAAQALQRTKYITLSHGASSSEFGLSLGAQGPCRQHCHRESRQPVWVSLWHRAAPLLGRPFHRLGFLFRKDTRRW